MTNTKSSVPNGGWRTPPAPDYDLGATAHCLEPRKCPQPARKPNRKLRDRTHLRKRTLGPPRLPATRHSPPPTTSFTHFTDRTHFRKRTPRAIFHPAALTTDNRQLTTFLPKEPICENEPPRPCIQAAPASAITDNRQPTTSLPIATHFRNQHRATHPSRPGLPDQNPQLTTPFCYSGAIGFSRSFSMKFWADSSL